MNEITNIVDQLGRAFAGNAWHGPSLSELLNDVGAKQAAARPLPAAHSIWDLVLHIAAWDGVVARRLKGETVDMPEEGDWPAVDDLSPEAWKSALIHLRTAQEQLVAAISQLREAELPAIAPGTDYSIYFMLHGVIQHNLYHGGQIALLKKG